MEDKRWLAGSRKGLPDCGEPKRIYAVFEAKAVGEPLDGKQAVNTRYECRSGMLVTLPVEKVFKTEEAALARLEEMKREDATNEVDDDDPEVGLPSHLAEG